MPLHLRVSQRALWHEVVFSWSLFFDAFTSLSPADPLDPPILTLARICFRCSTDLDDSAVAKWAQSKELPLKKFGPSRAVSQDLVVLMRSRGVEVLEALDDVGLLDVVGNACSLRAFGITSYGV